MASVCIDECRPLRWWLVEQARPQGIRHGGRFFARLMPLERALDRAAGGEWRSVAQNRVTWREREKIFIRSGRQDSIAWQ